MSDKFFIDFPSDEEVQRQIHTIVDKGLPRKKTFYRTLKEMHQQLGWNYIFRDYRELLLIGALFILYMAAFIFNLYQMQDISMYPDMDFYVNRLYAYLFVSAPLLYGTISVFSFMEKRETFETEMTCKYTVYQVSAYRMLVFSFTSILLNVIQIAFVSVLIQEFNPVMAMMISFTSLLIFSLGFLYVTTRHRSKMMQSLIIVGWILLNIGVSAISTTIYHQLLMNIPYVVYSAVIIVTGYLYFKNMKNLVVERRLNQC